MTIYRSGEEQDYTLILSLNGSGYLSHVKLGRSEISVEWSKEVDSEGRRGNQQMICGSNGIPFPKFKILKPQKMGSLRVSNRKNATGIERVSDYFLA